MEKEYVPEADKIIAEQKKIKEQPNMCQRDYIKWIPECIAYRFSRQLVLGSLNHLARRKITLRQLLMTIEGMFVLAMKSFLINMLMVLVRC